MTATIIDNTPARLSKLKNFLETQKIFVVQSFEVSNNLASNGSELFLIHKSNDNIIKFVQKLRTEKFIIFFSGPGIVTNIEGINYTDRMFNLPDVFNVGNEEEALNRIGKIVEILKNDINETNTITEIKMVLGFDEQLESLLQPFETANPFNGDNELKNAKEALNNYVKSKP